MEENSGDLFMSGKKSDIFFSNAEWTKIKNSSDSHGTFEMAEGVCESLIYHYGEKPCEIRGICKKAFVTDNNGYVIREISR